MTVRSARTMVEKMRGHEADAKEDERQILEACAATMMQTFRPGVPLRMQPIQVRHIERAATQTLNVGMALMQQGIVENLKSIHRDLGAVEDGLSRAFDGFRNFIMDRYRPSDELNAHVQNLVTSTSTVWDRAMTEIERQQLLHQKYDSDEDVELQRLFSKTPVGVPGRSGRGVIPSLDSIIQGMWVTALYQMVNAHRNEIFTLALVEYTRLTGANA